jgi:stage II sporulation protein R
MVLEMRGKIIVWGYLVILSLATVLNLYMPKTEAASKESIVIPGEAIRLRILANSDFEKDQALKRKVRDAVNAQITLWVQDLTSMEAAREVINEKLPEIQAIAEKVVREQGSNQSVKVEFKDNVQFPTKLYGQFLYPAGKYQAILITLGKGEGANWWCVLYPPLCFLDFSNGVAVSDGFEEKEVAAAESKEKNESKQERVSEIEAKPVEKEVEEDQEEEMQSEKKVEEEQPVMQQPEKKQAVKSQVKRSKEQELTKKEKDQAEETEKDEIIKKDKMTKKIEIARKVEIQEEIQSEKEKQLEKSEEETEEKAQVSKETKREKAEPVYVSEDEQPVKVKFFVVEMWDKLLN